MFAQLRQRAVRELFASILDLAVGIAQRVRPYDAGCSPCPLYRVGWVESPLIRKRSGRTGSVGGENKKSGIFGEFAFAVVRVRPSPTK